MKQNFSSLTAQEKRVAIAKDVIKQLTIGKFIAMQSDYCNSESLERELDYEKKELSKIIPKHTCTCCAKGSLFISDIRIRNNYKRDELPSDDEEIKRRLKGIFYPHQLNLIETAFEKDVMDTDDKKLNSSGDCWDKELTPLAESAIKFGKKFRSHKERLVAIMKNVIKNKGEFIPDGSIKS